MQTSQEIRPQDDNRERISHIEWLQQFPYGACVHFCHLLAHPVLTPMEEAELLERYISAQKRVAAVLLSMGYPLAELRRAAEAGRSVFGGDHESADALVEKASEAADQERSSKAARNEVDEAKAKERAERAAARESREEQKRANFLQTLKKRRSVVTPAHCPLITEMVAKCEGKSLGSKVVLENAEALFDMFSYEVFLQAISFLDRSRHTAELQTAFQAADADRHALENRLYQHNARLVVSLVRKKMNFMQSSLLPDLMQVGSIGLVEGIRKYRFGMHKGANTKLSTIATPWITHRISRWMDDHGSNIRVPVHQKEMVRLIRSALDVLCAERETTNEQTIPDQAIADYLATKGLKRVPTLDEIETTRRFCFKEVSINAPVGADSSVTMEDVVADPKSTVQTVTATHETQAVSAAVREAIKQLSLDHQLIVHFQYGMLSPEEGTRTVLDFGKQRLDWALQRIKENRERVNSAPQIPRPPRISTEQ